MMTSLGVPFTLHDADGVSVAALEQHFAALNDYYTRTRYYDLAYPGFYDVNHRPLAALLSGQLLNNIGDPYDEGHGRDHTKAYERAVVDYLADLFHAPRTRWGYVTTGSTEGTDHAVRDARLAFPDQEPVMFASREAHYSVAKSADRYRLPLVKIRTDPTGRMDISDLRAQLIPLRHRPVVIVATVGTTMTEAVDDVAEIANVCDSLAIRRRRIHVDAALAGIPLALLPAHERPAFDFAAGASTLVVSGHKFPGTLHPCAVVLYAEAPVAARAAAVPYVGSGDSTITGSRSGHTPLLLFSSFAARGTAGHRRRAEKSREIAADVQQRLLSAGLRAERGPHAFTVVIDQPPPDVLTKWVVAPDGSRAHLIAKPNTDPAAIDEFLTDLTRTSSRPIAMPRPRPTLPAPRNAHTPADVDAENHHGGRRRVTTTARR